MKKMDVIKFKLDKHFICVNVYINGCSLAKIARDLEKGIGMEGYEYYGVTPCYLFNELIKNERANVLSCEETVDCPTYFVTIRETENTVIWEALHHPRLRRQPLNLFDFVNTDSNNQENNQEDTVGGVLHETFFFEFDKKQYYKELVNLIKISILCGQSEYLPMDVRHGTIEINGEQIDLSVFEKQFLQQKKHFKFY